jgi:hypothetical protein
MRGMSWEALRLTSRTPSEVYDTLGPHGVEELLREARSAVWRETPEAERNYRNVRRRLQEVFDRNMAVWGRIKKPSPEAYFADLLPLAADGHIRQALVLTWMMMPRAGGREFKDVAKIVAHLFQRTLDNWDEDDVIFTKGFGGGKKKSPAKAEKPAKAPKKAVKKKAAKKR